MRMKGSGRFMKAYLTHMGLLQYVWKSQKEWDIPQSDWDPNTVCIVWICVINCFDYSGLS